jgi:predicted N-acetyltransferase YhbS
MVRQPNLQAQAISSPGSLEIHAETFTTDGADECWIARTDNGQKAGQCSLWWSTTPTHATHRIGLIGHFEARDHVTASMLLGRSMLSLKSAGCTLAIGPMDGDSWHSYRATTWAGSQPAFAMEPPVNVEYAEYFAEAGFSPYSNYVSNEIILDTVSFSRLHRLLIWFAMARFRIRNIRIDDYNAEIERIHQFCCRAFTNNHLYSPIDLQAFQALYAPMKSTIRPEFVFIAEKAGRVIGLLFAIPDFNQQLRGESVDTLIFKTLAIAPEMRERGLGSVLMYRGYRAASAAGYRRIIGALMEKKNRLLEITDRFPTNIIREYALFAKEL